MICKIIKLLTALNLFFCLTGPAQAKDLFPGPGLFKKKTITIAVTDSGLGGLSVVADAVEKLKAYKGFEKIEILFFNALFSNKGGYNSLAERSEKVAVFNAALENLEKKYSPDIILIACNTLSVIYPDTRFASKTLTPVKGIVDDGVDLIADRIKGKKEAKAILFATQTTVIEGLHRKQLMEQGIGKDRIIYQACPELTLFIEQGYDSPETAMLIQAYVDEAVTNIGDPHPGLVASFNCTHYGYSKALWEEAFKMSGIKLNTFLDPNYQMVNSLLDPAYKNRFKTININVKMVSMVNIPKTSILSIGRYLEDVSPETAAALRAFELEQDLFAWKNLVKDRIE